MKGRARRARLDERCIWRQMMREFESLRDWKCRRRRRHGRTCQGDNGADRANVIRVLIRIVAGRRKLLGGLERRRSLHRNRMEVAKRKPKLDGERKQRSSRAISDVRSEPLHADTHPVSESRGISALPTLLCNVAGNVARRQSQPICRSPEFISLCDFRNVR